MPAPRHPDAAGQRHSVAELRVHAAAAVRVHRIAGPARSACPRLHSACAPPSDCAPNEGLTVSAGPSSEAGFRIPRQPAARAPLRQFGGFVQHQRAPGQAKREPQPRIGVAQATDRVDSEAGVRRAAVAPHAYLDRRRQVRAAAERHRIHAFQAQAHPVHVRRRGCQTGGLLRCRPQHQRVRVQPQRETAGRGCRQQRGRARPRRPPTCRSPSPAPRRRVAPAAVRRGRSRPPATATGARQPPRRRRRGTRPSASWSPRHRAPSAANSCPSRSCATAPALPSRAQSRSPRPACRWPRRRLPQGRRPDR